MPRYTHLLLDLDDTLYPGTSGVWEAVRDRIQEFIETRLALPENEAARLRRRYLEQFGTTLAGLIEEFDIDAQDYLDYVHDVPIEQLLSPNPALRTMLASIGIPRIVFTNAYLPHAQRVLEQLGIADQISQVIDIYALDFINKPKPASYAITLNLISAQDPSTVVYVDDRIANLGPAAELKMTTVLVASEPKNNTHLHIANITDLVRALPVLIDRHDPQSYA